MRLWMHTFSKVLGGSLALALVSIGAAEATESDAQSHAGAQAAAAADASDQLPPDQDVSETVIALAGWVVKSRDSQGYPFAIIDKRAAQILVFGRNGRLLGAAPVLIGSAVGDHTAPGITGYALADIPGHDRTTPAGRFVGGFGPSLDAGPVLWVDYDAAVSIHPIPAGAGRERRAARLASASPADNRITHGCINVSPEFYENVVRRTFDRGGLFYVLPDRASSLAATFPDFARSRETAQSSDSRPAQPARN